MRAFLLGAGAFAALAYCLSAALALTIAASGSTARVGVRSLVLVAVERGDDGSTATTIGPGLLLVGLVGGALNALTGEILERRRNRREIT